MIWERLRVDEFDEAIEKSKGVCAIPMGCLETYGHHMPVGTDNLHASWLVRKASEIEPVCIFPDFTFGGVQGGGKFKGTVILTTELQQELLTQFCEEIARNGFKKIILVNSHGGSEYLINNFLRSTLNKKKDYIVTACYKATTTAPRLLKAINQKGKESFPELTDDDIKIITKYVEQKKIEGHGGFGSIAFAYASYPELLRMDKICEVDGVPTGPKPYANIGLDVGMQVGWMIKCPNGLSADPAEDVNERIGQAGAKILIDELAETFKVLKNEDSLLKWNAAWHDER